MIRLRIIGLLAGLVAILGGAVALNLDGSANASSAMSQDSVPFLFQDSTGAFVPGFPAVDGSSASLTRHMKGVSAQIHTSGLPSGAYTVWWVVFNEPGNCSDGACGEDDVLPPGVNPAAEVSVMRATGKFVGSSGIGGFGSVLKVGDTTEALFGNGLTNLWGAEIHQIVRYHGPAQQGLVTEQIKTVGGGCNNAPGLPGEPGDFFCYEPQAVEFPAP